MEQFFFYHTFLNLKKNRFTKPNLKSFPNATIKHGFEVPNDKNHHPMRSVTRRVTGRLVGLDLLFCIDPTAR